MREIRFRCWDNEKKEWVSENKSIQMFCLDLQGRVWSRNFKSHPLVSTKDPGFILMEYTGLKDSLGKEIFEGDLLRYGDPKSARYEEDIYQVKFEQGCFLAYRFDKYYETLYDDISEVRSEIIGNVYEHPEFLKGEEE